uniref:SKP1-like protein n=1 Tax=Oryza punctata TaxID=4537 RepID=A0A0E0LZ48_ORYPU
MAASAAEGTSGGDGGVDVKKTIDLVSNDGERFEVARDAAQLCKTLRWMIKDGYGRIPLPNVASSILARVVDYLGRHAAAADADAMDDDGLHRFDADFLAGVDQDTLFDLLLAANYLQADGLLDLACKKVAGMMTGKSPEQMREIFHIVNDLTPEEENEIREEISWALN